MTQAPQLILSPGPHLRAGLTTRQIMWWVNVSLIPVFVWAVYIYGVAVLGLMISGIIGTALGEGLVNRLRRQRQTLKDGSAVLTALLLVATLSPGMAIWMPMVGGFVAIVFAKMLFGGLGYNIFNPALIGRAFLMVSFPLAMTTTWLKPFETVTQATPLNLWKLTGTLSGDIPSLFFGFKSGSIGEVSLPLVLFGGAILVWKGIIKPHIPVSVVIGLLLIGFFSKAPLFHLLSGGLWFGAIYMATDYVTAPIATTAQIIFGLSIGLLTGVIRLWGGYPEGICYAILILNATTPAFNHWFRPMRAKLEVPPS